MSRAKPISKNSRAANWLPRYCINRNCSGMGWDIDKSHESDDLEGEGCEVLPTQNSVVSGFPLFSPTLL